MSTFKDTFLKALNLESMSADQQARLLETIGQSIIMAVVARAVETMSEADGDEMDTLLDTDPSPDALFEFLASKVPNIEEMIAEEGKEIVDISMAALEGMK
jgi:hypothetical protein